MRKEELVGYHNNNNNYNSIALAAVRLPEDDINLGHQNCKLKCFK